MRLLEDDLRHIIHATASYGDGRAGPPFSDGQTLLSEEDIDKSITECIQIKFRNDASTTFLPDLLLGSDASDRTTHDAEVQGGFARADGNLLSSVGDVGIGDSVVHESLSLNLTSTRSVVVVDAGIGVGEGLKDGFVEVQVIPQSEI